MNGLALGFLGLAVASDPIELPRDVEVIDSRQFAMPLQVDPKRKDKIERVRLFLSEDRGKTWKHQKNYKPTDEEMIFTAPRDGLYWFALQVVSKEGRSDPAGENELTPAMKVYVNTERKVLKRDGSYESLQRELEDLRKRVEQVEKKIKELESNREPRRARMW